MRAIISETDWQIIISTHEENFYELMKVKLDSRYYNSKFLCLNGSFDVGRKEEKNHDYRRDKK